MSFEEGGNCHRELHPDGLAGVRRHRLRGCSLFLKKFW